MKPLSFTRWLDIVYRMDVHTFKAKSDKFRARAHRRYTDYLIGWEKAAEVEVDPKFYII